MNRDFTKPIVVVSRCLEFEACRYNAQMIANFYVRQLMRFVEFRPICPEMEIGLSTPRDPVRIVVEKKGRQLIQPATGRNFTIHMHHFAKKFLEDLGEVDGFILKNRSPSCGIRDTKQFQSVKGPSLGKGSGLFAEAVLNQWSGLAIEDEGRLTNFRLREHFLIKLFLLADFRKIKTSGTPKDLVQFQTQNKLLLMAYHQSKLKSMGRLVANLDKSPFDEICQIYQLQLQHALARPAKRGAMINALMHILGYFSKQLSSQEKALFLDNLTMYRNGQTTLGTLVNLLKSWTLRFNQPYLRQQTIFFPYPEALIHLSDSGKFGDPV